jgi:nitroreductase
MNTKEAILKRRSIRKFKSTPVQKELISELLEAACAAPSACNKKPYAIYVITNEELLEKLNLSSRFTNMPSPLSIVVAADMERVLPRQYRDYWMQDCAAVTENILLMVTELGLGACWNGLYPNPAPTEHVRTALGLSESIVPLALIRIGYPDEEREPNGGINESIVTYFE